MLFTFALLAAIAQPAAASARTLITPNYTITITQKCAEYEVGCSNVQYHAVSRSGKSLTLVGTQVMAMCKDGTTPCHSEGYRFTNRGTTYLISEDGELTVKQGSKTLLDEQGKWQGE